MPDGLFQPPRGVIGLDLDLRDGDIILLLLLNADAGQCACAGVDLLVGFQGKIGVIHVRSFPVCGKDTVHRPKTENFFEKMRKNY